MSSKRGIRELLAKVSQFADVDIDSVATSLWKGSVTLRNIRLRPDAFGSAASVGLAGVHMRHLNASWALL